MYAQSNLNNSSQMTKNPDICDSLECKYLEIISLILSIVSLGLSGTSLYYVIKVVKKLEEEKENLEKGNKNLKKEAELVKKGMVEINKSLDTLIGKGTQS